MYVQCRGGNHNRCEGYLEYCGECSVPWGDTMFCYLSTSTVLNTPMVLMISPTCITIICILISPHNTEYPPRYSRYPHNAHDSPHGTEHPHGTQNIPHIYHDIPHGTEHPPRYSGYPHGTEHHPRYWTHIIQGDTLTSIWSLKGLRQCCAHICCPELTTLIVCSVEVLPKR